MKLLKAVSKWVSNLISRPELTLRLSDGAVQRNGDYVFYLRVSNSMVACNIKVSPILHHRYPNRRILFTPVAHIAQGTEYTLECRVEGGNPLDKNRVQSFFLKDISGDTLDIETPQPRYPISVIFSNMEGNCWESEYAMTFDPYLRTLLLTYINTRQSRK